ncbi:MAG: glycosyltransferase family 2 protein [Patescibacteria group bacterium]
MISVIIPAYNEETSIGSVVKSLKPLASLVVVVDDGSTDQTVERASAAGAVVISHIVNRGYGAAIATGTEYALSQGANHLVHFDADGQFVAEEINKALAPIQAQQVEVVLGSRFLGRTVDLPLIRKLILKVATIFTWAFSGIKLTDAQNGFRAFTAEAARQIIIKQDGKAATSEIIDEIARLKLKYLEVPVTVHYTQYSLNKAKANTVFDIWRIVRDLFLGKLIK